MNSLVYLISTTHPLVVFVGAYCVGFASSSVFRAVLRKARSFPKPPEFLAPVQASDGAVVTLDNGHMDELPYSTTRTPAP